jgi:hypothetical protein
METNPRNPLKFFLLVLLLSIPFWILGALTQDLTKILHSMNYSKALASK